MLEINMFLLYWMSAIMLMRMTRMMMTTTTMRVHNAPSVHGEGSKLQHNTPSAQAQGVVGGGGCGSGGGGAAAAPDNTLLVASFRWNAVQ